MNGPCRYGCTVMCLSFNPSFESEWLHRHNARTLIHACTHTLTPVCMCIHSHAHRLVYIESVHIAYILCTVTHSPKSDLCFDESES